MGAFSSLTADGLTALFASHGEPCTLPSGAAVGIFHPVGAPPVAGTSEVGLSTRLSQQPAPTLLLRAADAENLADGDPVTVRATAYRVTRTDDSGLGLHTVRLMPDTHVQPEGDRWR